MSTIACDIPAPRWMNPRGGLSADGSRTSHQGCGLSHDYYVERFSSAIDANSVDCPKNAHRR